MYNEAKQEQDVIIAVRRCGRDRVQKVAIRARPMEPRVQSNNLPARESHYEPALKSVRNDIVRGVEYGDELPILQFDRSKTDFEC